MILIFVKALVQCIKNIDLYVLHLLRISFIIFFTMMFFMAKRRTNKLDRSEFVQIKRIAIEERLPVARSSIGPAHIKQEVFCELYLYS